MLEADNSAMVELPEYAPLQDKAAIRVPSSTGFQDNITPQRIRRLLQQHYHGPHAPSRVPWLACHGTLKSADRGTPESRLHERRIQAEEMCRRYHLSALDPTDHVERLEKSISDILRCSFPPYRPKFLWDYTSETEDRLVKHAFNLLSRLPRIPLPLVEVGHSASLSCISEGYLLFPNEPREWENLLVVAHVPDMAVLLALIISARDLLHRDWELQGMGGLRDTINTLIELLDVCSSLSSTAVSAVELEAWLVVKSMLWSSWQRCTMLIRWFILGLHIESGFKKMLDGFSFRQYTGGDQKTRDAQHNSLVAIHDVPQYMCMWALRQLQSDRSAICQDFRRLCSLFDAAFPGRRPRCILQSQMSHQCDGSSVQSCQRFKGMVITDQSQHAEEQPQRHMCQRLYWNERSYRLVNGARAVKLNEDQFTGLLEYCEASNDTLAISHVWSHGQGGRPEPDGTGFNSCLHRRYSRLARSLGCLSYWMDTPCIPQDHQLREEAIQHINEVFAHSRAVLICDRDLMEIEITEGPEKLHIYETILAVILVCDWNIRSWTFLESMRGRRRIHVLCKNEVVVSLRDVLEVVHESGRIDIAILAFTSEHLLPWQDIGDASIPEYDPDLQPIRVSEATSFLVNRHASRPGDDIVIWTLLMGKKPFADPVDFWKNQWTLLREIPTGFLMSDVPRLGTVPGLRWAPSQPCLSGSIQSFSHSASKFEAHAYAGTSQQVYDGANSRYGFIHHGGALEAVWFAFEFTITTNSSKVYQWHKCDEATKFNLLLNDISTKFGGSRVPFCLLRPAAAYPVSENFTVLYKGRGGGPLVAVISHYQKQAWKWEGLYEWPLEVELPVFNERLLKIV